MNEYDKGVDLEEVSMSPKPKQDPDYIHPNDLKFNVNELQEFNNNPNFNNNNQEGIERFQVPGHLKKTFIVSLILFVLGCTLIGIGFIQQVQAADPGKGITFWVLGSVVLIPGGYYTYQFFKAKRSRDPDERNDILEEIPEL